MSYNFLDFTKEHYPHVWKEFSRFKRKEILPTIGTKVITLVSGYGGGGGQIRYVVEGHSDEYIYLSDTPNGKAIYLCKIETWWKDLEIVNEQESIG